MKNITLIVMSFFMLFSCREEKLSVPCASESNNEGRANWLNDQVKMLKKDLDSSKIFQLNFQSGAAIEICPCYQCPDAVYYLYDCDGNLICYSGGFAGTNTCTNDYKGNPERILIWEE